VSVKTREFGPGYPGDVGANRESGDDEDEKVLPDLEPVRSGGEFSWTAATGEVDAVEAVGGDSELAQPSEDDIYRSIDRDAAHPSITVVWDQRVSWAQSDEFLRRGACVAQETRDR
jgi:hypothetical protein